MTQVEKKFGKYAVTVDSDMGDGATGCWIEYKTKSKHYSTSLQCAQDTGELEDNSDGATVKIESAILDDIEEWAIENGY